MKHQIAAAILALLAATFVWQAFGQTEKAETPCLAACKSKYDKCMKQVANKPQDSEEFLTWQLTCQLDYRDCVKACK